MGSEPWVTGHPAGRSPGVFTLGGCWCLAVLTCLAITASVSRLHQPSGDAVAPLVPAPACSGAQDVPHGRRMLPDKVRSEMASTEVSPAPSPMNPPPGTGGTQQEGPRPDGDTGCWGWDVKSGARRSLKSLRGGATVLCETLPAPPTSSQRGKGKGSL